MFFKYTPHPLESRSKQITDGQDAVLEEWKPSDQSEQQTYGIFVIFNTMRGYFRRLCANQKPRFVRTFLRPSSRYKFRHHRVRLISIGLTEERKEEVTFQLILRKKMFRTEIPSVPGPTSSGRPAVKLPGGPAKPPALGALSRSFEESLLRRLKTLDPPAPSLSWLASAVDLVSATYSDAAVLVSGLGVSGSSETPLVAAYLDHSVKVLDVCNSISSEIEKLRRRRLLIHLVLHLLRQSGARTPENIRRARESLAECRIVADRSRGSGLADSAGALIGDLVRGLGSAPRGKVSTEERALWRTIYSVGLLSAFVSGVAVAVFNGSPITMSAAAVPGEVLWAVAFEKLKTAVSGWFIGKEGRFAGELEEVELAVRGIAVALGKRKEDQGETEGVDDAVRELEKAREKYSEGLERLHNGINGFFRSVLCTRNALLRNFR